MKHVKRVSEARSSHLQPSDRKYKRHLARLSRMGQGVSLCFAASCHACVTRHHTKWRRPVMTDQQLPQSVAISVCRICFSAMIFWISAVDISSVQPSWHKRSRPASFTSFVRRLGIAYQIILKDSYFSHFSSTLIFLILGPRGLRYNTVRDASPSLKGAVCDNMPYSTFIRFFAKAARFFRNAVSRSSITDSIFFFFGNWLLEHFLALFLSHIRPVRLQVTSQVLHDWLPVIHKPPCHCRLEIRDFYIRKRRLRSDSSLGFFGILCKFLTKVAKLFIK